MKGWVGKGEIRLGFFSAEWIFLSISALGMGQKEGMDLLSFPPSFFQFRLPGTKNKLLHKKRRGAFILTGREGGGTNVDL